MQKQLQGENTCSEEAGAFAAYTSTSSTSMPTPGPLAGIQSERLPKLAELQRSIDAARTEIRLDDCAKAVKVESRVLSPLVGDIINREVTIETRQTADGLVSTLQLEPPPSQDQFQELHPIPILLTYKDLQ